MDLTRRIAQYAAGFREKPIDSQVYRLASQHFLDTFACVLCGSEEKTATVALSYLEKNRQTAGVKIRGTKDLLVRPEDAAYYYGICAHDCDYDDLSKNLSGHPGAGILPVVMALSGEKQVSGELALRAFLAGIEVDAAIGRAFLKSGLHPGWMQTTVLGIFGAVAAGGVLIGMEPEVLTQALGIAAGEASGVKVNFGSAAKDIAVGHMCGKAVFSLEMARLGLRASGDALGGPEGFFKTLCPDCQTQEIIAWMESGCSDLTSPGIILKPYPSCRGVHNGIDGMLALVREYGFGPEEVERVLCLVQDTVIHSNRYPVPKTREQGKFSLAYCLALCACHGRIAVEDFAADKEIEPELFQFMEKVSVEVDESFRDAKSGIEVQVTLKSGKTYSYRGAYAKGDPNHPLGEKEHEEKLYDCFLRSLSREQAEACIHRFRELEKVLDAENLWFEE